MSDSDMPTNYAHRVGERLRLIRKQKGLSLQEVEQTSSQEFKASVLGAYERGERAISVPRLQRLAKFYTVPVDQLLPQDADGFGATHDDEVIDLTTGDSETVVDPTPPRGIRRDQDERVSIDLTRLQSIAAQEREMLTRYLGMIQVQRQDFNGRVLTIRAEDVKVLALMLEATPVSLQRRLEELGLKL